MNLSARNEKCAVENKTKWRMTIMKKLLTLAVAAAMTLFDLVAVLHFCLATKRETEDDARRSIAILMNARKDLLELVRGKTH